MKCRPYSTPYFVFCMCTLYLDTRDRGCKTWLFLVSALKCSWSVQLRRSQQRTPKVNCPLRNYVHLSYVYITVLHYLMYLHIWSRRGVSLAVIISWEGGRLSAFVHRALHLWFCHHISACLPVCLFRSSSLVISWPRLVVVWRETGLFMWQRVAMQPQYSVWHSDVSTNTGH